MKNFACLRRALRFSIVTMLVVVSAGCFSTAPQVDPNIAGLNEVLATEFVTTGGNQSSIADSKDKIVLLHFFASWCSECAAEAPTLSNLYYAFEGSDFQIIGVAVDDDPFEAQRFATQFKLPFPVLLDTQGELKRYFSINDLPVTLLLDRTGVPVTFQDPQTGSFTAKLTGARRWDTAQPVEMIAAMIEAR